MTFMGAGAAALCGVLCAPAYADGGRLRVFVAGAAAPPARVRSVVVDSDTTSADSATIVLDTSARARLPVAGDALVVDAVGGAAAASIFKGEITGVEPLFEPGCASAVTIRTFNKLHRLTRGRKSRTFEKVSDADIAARLAGEAGLAFGPSGLEATTGHDRVVQHNQADLEFLRARVSSATRHGSTTPRSTSSGISTRRRCGLAARRRAAVLAHA